MRPEAARTAEAVPALLLRSGSTRPLVARCAGATCWHRGCSRRRRSARVRCCSSCASTRPARAWRRSSCGCARPSAARLARRAGRARRRSQRRVVPVRPHLGDRSRRIVERHARRSTPPTSTASSARSRSARPASAVCEHRGAARTHRAGGAAPAPAGERAVGLRARHARGPLLHRALPAHATRSACAAAAWRSRRRRTRTGWARGASATLDVLDIDERNAKATVHGDLEAGAGLASDAYDCFILTQTLHLLYDFDGRAAARRARIEAGRRAARDGAGGDPASRPRRARSTPTTGASPRRRCAGCSRSFCRSTRSRSPSTATCWRPPSSSRASPPKSSRATSSTIATRTSQ